MRFIFFSYFVRFLNYIYVLLDLAIIAKSVLCPLFFRSFFRFAARGNYFSVLFSTGGARELFFCSFFNWRREGALILRIPKYALHILYLFHMIP